MKIEKEKVQRVVDQLVLKSVKKMQKFLWLANYYRQFVKDFSRVAKPLYKMTRENIKQNWRERQQKVFKNLKERFITEPVLVTSDLDKKMKVKVDTSNLAIGEMLSIKCENKKQRPVAYVSKLLNEAKKIIKFTIKRCW